MANPLGYLTENSQRAYPFKENSVLEPLTNDFLVDAAITIHTPAITTVTVSRIRKEQIAGTSRFNAFFVFQFYSGTSAFVESETMSILNVDSDRTGQDVFATYTQAFTNVDIKLTVGPRFFVVEPIPTFSYDFPLELELQFEASAVNLYVPKVEVTFQNSMGGGAVENLDTITSGDLNLACGANIAIAQNGKTLDLSVTPRAGTGLYDVCSDSPGIKTINNIKPNHGNFNLNGGNCFDFTPVLAGLQLDHLCDPKCSPAQIANYAHYINRIKDGIVLVSEFAVKRREQLLAQMAAYAEKMNALLAPEAPYLEVEVVSSKNPQKLYDSFAVGVYNPNNNGTTPDVPISLTLSVNPELGSGFTYVPGTAYIREDDVVQNVPALGFNQRTMSCRSTIEHGFVLYNLNLRAKDKHVEFFLNEDVVDHPSGAYKMQVMYPTASYFTLKYKKVWDATQSKYKYKFVINLFDKSIVDQTMREGTLRISFPSGFDIVEGTVVTDLNKEKTIHPNHGNTLLLSNLNIDFTHKAEVTFDALAAPGIYASLVDFGVSSPPSGFSRPITIE